MKRQAHDREQERRWLQRVLRCRKRFLHVATATLVLLLLLPWPVSLAETGPAVQAESQDVRQTGSFASVQATSGNEPAALLMVATNLPETKQAAGTLEISLQVKAGSCFQTAGMVLEYDYSKIRPIAWDSQQTPVSIPDLSAQTEESVAWKEAAVLESRSPGSISAKPALSFRRGDRAYLYVAAETQEAEVLSLDTLVMSVRFAYTPGAVPSKDYVASAVNFAEDRAGKKVAFASPVKGSVLYQSKDPISKEALFFYHMPLEKTESGLVRENMSIPAEQRIDEGIYLFTYLPEGRSAGERAATAADFVSLAFYDWDDTLLGTRIVAKDTGWLIDPNTQENRTQYVNADGTAKYTDGQLASMGVAPLVPEGNVLSGGLDQNGVTVSAINKAGYSYAGWVDYSGTSTPDVGIIAGPGQTIAGTGQQLVKLSDFEGNRVLRVAYDEKLIGEGNNVFRRYDIYQSPFKRDDNNRFLETIITVVRKEQARKISGDEFLVVSLRPRDAGETRIKISLGNADVESYVLAMPIDSEDTYARLNALSFALCDKDGITRGKGIVTPAGDIVDRDSGGI